MSPPGEIGVNRGFFSLLQLLWWLTHCTNIDAMLINP